MTKRLTSFVLIVTLMFGGSIVPDSSAKSKFNSYIRGKTQNSKSMEPKWHAVTKTNIIKYVIGFFVFGQTNRKAFG